MSKLEPIYPQMPTLAEVRADQDSVDWGLRGVAVPAAAGLCWAEVRIRGSSDYNPAFWGCGNKPREGFLTCRVHNERELAARELKCEVEGLKMVDMAYSSLKDKEDDRKAKRVAAIERLRQLIRKS